MKNRLLPLGYVWINGTIQIDPHTYTAVLDSFQCYIHGMSYQSIAEWLTQQGVPMRSDTPVWNKHAIRRILIDRRYLGTHEYPKIVPLPVFEEAAHQMILRNNTTPSSPIMLTIAKRTYCTVCGARVWRDTRNQKQPLWHCMEQKHLPYVHIDDSMIESQILHILESIRLDTSKLRSSLPLSPQKHILLSTPEKYRCTDPAALYDSILHSIDLNYAALPDPELPETRQLISCFQSISNPIETLDLALFSDVVYRVQLEPGGTVQLQMKNGAVI